MSLVFWVTFASKKQCEVFIMISFSYFMALADLDNPGAKERHGEH